MKDSTRYVGTDVHPASCRFHVRSSVGRREFECTVPTTQTAILELIGSIGGRVVIAFEEGNLSEWLYGVLKPVVAKVVVCNPRENRAGRAKSKSEKIDAEQLWAYGGLSVVMHGSSETEYVDGRARRRKGVSPTRGLTKSCNRRVKAALKGAAMTAAGSGGLKPFYDRLPARNLARELARVTLARKIATLVLVLSKKGERFDVAKLENKPV